MRASIEKLIKDRTMIAISHRFSTIDAADKIVFLKEGKIGEEGGHTARLSESRCYAAFCAPMDARLQSMDTKKPSR